MLALTLVTLTSLALAPSGQEAKAKEHWTPLFNGRDLTGWYTFLQKHGKNQDPDRVITIEDGAIHLYKHAPEGSHVVMGYIATEKEYGDYHLRLQYRWGGKKFEPRLQAQARRRAVLSHHRPGRSLAARPPVPDRADQRGRPDRAPRRPARHHDRPEDPLREDADLPGRPSRGASRTCSAARGSPT